MDSSRMQSSPPLRGTSPRMPPSSPAGSEYSLDLDALGSSSSASSPVAERVVPQVKSEDIDGPTDFTINMLDWMKGGRAPGRDKPQQDAAITTGTPSMFRTNAPHLQPTVEDYSSPVRPSNPTPHGGRTPATEARTPVTEERTSATQARAPTVTRSPSGTIGRSSMHSPLQTQGGASQYLMGQIQRLRSELAAEKEERAAEKAAHAAEVERLASQHARELQSATSELRATRDAHTSEMQRLSTDYSQQLKAAFEAAAIEARNNNAAHAEEMERTRSQHAKNIHNTNAAHAAEMERTKSQHAKDLKAATDAAVQCKAACAAEIRRLQSQHSEQMQVATNAFQLRNAENTTEMARLRSQHADELTAAITQPEETAAAHAEEIQRIIDEHKAVDIAKDAAITEKVRAREARYKEKIAVRDTKLAEKDAELQDLREKMENLEKMYKKMGSELMRAWGREEFGDTGEKQKYCYKYAKATSA
jgi:hypothetical protein